MSLKCVITSNTSFNIVAIPQVKVNKLLVVLRFLNNLIPRKQKMIKEEYKDIPDTEFVPLMDICDVHDSIYMINKLGHIKNTKTNKVSTSYFNLHGKIPIKSFRVNGKKGNYPVHILVAKTFLEKEEGKPEVDHINRDTLDFRLENLRWVNRLENLRNRNVPQYNKYIIYQKLDDNGNVIEEISFKGFESKIITDRINRVIVKNKKAYGYYWKRINLEINEYTKKHNIDLDKEEFIPIPNDRRKISKSGIILTNDWLYSLGSECLGGYRKIKINNQPVYVHRLVYELFTGDKLTESDFIDHIDTDAGNNTLDNLRKVDQKGNMNNPITVSKVSIPVAKYSLDGVFIEEYPSISNACMSMGLSRTNNCISMCCKGKINTSHGFIWKYKN